MICRVRQPVLLAAFLFFSIVGCKPSEKTSAAANVSYEITFLHREMSPSGPVLTMGQNVASHKASVSSTIEVGAMGMKSSVQVKTIGQDEATFKIVFPDGTSEQVELKTGESKDFFEKGGAAGVRVRINRTNS